MKLDVITNQLQFPEGPIALADGSVLVVEIKAGRLSRVMPTGEIVTVAELGGGPNGAAIGPDKAVYVCNNGGFAWIELPGGLSAPHGKAADYKNGSIQRVDLETGAVTTLYDRCGERPLSGPNDIVFDSDGGFWFTDIGKDHADGHDYGAIYYARADGSFISRQRDRVNWPNGIGLSPDGRTLFVAETWTCRLWSYEVAEPGVLAPAPSPFVPGTLVTSMPGFTPFDSLAVERNGNVCVATCLNGGITIVAPDGSLEHLPIPDMITTNICFGGADMQDAWITGSASGTLFKLRWPRPGLSLAYNA